MKPTFAFLAILAVAAPAWEQQEGWSDSRFHRVYLRNGNFIDGNVIADKPNEVILLMKAGEMAIRRDQIEKVELVKMRSWNDKPIVLETPKGKGTPGNPGGTANVPQINTLTPDGIKKAVDKMIAKVKSNPNEKEFPVDELKATGDEGLAYLAAKTAGADLNLQNAVMSALINLKDVRGPKTQQVLDSFLSGSAPALRGMALTVLTVEAGESTLAKYIRPALKDPDPGVRIIAISALSAVEDKAWFDDIAESFGDANKDVRSRAIQLCKRLSDKNGLQDKLMAALVSNLKNSEPEVRAAMASTIGSMNIQQSWSNVAPLLNDSEPTVRAAAAQTLQNLAATESIPDLVQAIRRESDKWARVYLANAAQRMRIQDAVESLIGWLSSPDGDVQAAAEAALRAITGEAHGRDVAKWQAWFQGRK